MGLRYFIGVECTYIRNCQSLVLSQTSMGQVSMLFLRRLFQKSHPLPCSTEHASHRAYSGSSALPWRCSASQQSHSCPPCARGCGWDMWQMLQEGIGISMSSGFLSFTLLYLMTLFCLCCRIWWWDIPAGNVLSFSFVFIRKGDPGVALTQVCSVPLCHYSHERCSVVFHLILPQSVLFLFLQS